jgi:hypothetical protein
VKVSNFDGSSKEMVSYKNQIKVHSLQTAKKFVAEKEIFLKFNCKTRQNATADMAKQFYASDDLSRIIARINDYVSVNSEDRKVHLAIV